MQATAPAEVDPTMQAHWEDFMNRAFIMLGPRRFDEVKLMTQELQQATPAAPLGRRARRPTEMAQ